MCTCALLVWYLLDIASWSEARGDLTRALWSRETTRVLVTRVAIRRGWRPHQQPGCDSGLQLGCKREVRLQLILVFYHVGLTNTINPC